MAKLTIEKKHSLGKKEAVSRLKTLVKDLAEKNSDVISSFTQNWNSGHCEFTISAMKFTFTGKVAVSEDNVLFDLEYPFLARPFKGKVETLVSEEIDKALC